MRNLVFNAGLSGNFVQNQDFLTTTDTIFFNRYLHK